MQFLSDVRLTNAHCTALFQTISKIHDVYDVPKYAWVYMVDFRVRGGRGGFAELVC